MNEIHHLERTEKHETAYDDVRWLPLLRAGQVVDE
jgi:hypothetical protein